MGGLHAGVFPVRAGASGQPGPGAGRRRPILPLLLVIATLSLGTACTTRGSVTPGPAEATAAPPAEPFRAQVVGGSVAESPRAPGLPDRMAAAVGERPSSSPGEAPALLGGAAN